MAYCHFFCFRGDDFRPAFGKIKEITALFSAPIIVLTATATLKTRKFIIEKLELNDPTIIIANPDRPNIFYSKEERLPSMDTLDDLDRILTSIGDELRLLRRTYPLTIVYTDLETISYCYKFLDNYLGVDQYVGEHIAKNRIFAQYHHYYSDSMKDIIIKDICSTDPVIGVVFATIAMGMGLDAKNVRKIIHFKPPTTLEKYLQETGRAGRDGYYAEVILYYNNTDIRVNRPGIQKALINYCRSYDICLRSQLLSHLSYKINTNTPEYFLCRCCSVCKKKCDCGLCAEPYTEE